MARSSTNVRPSNSRCSFFGDALSDAFVGGVFQRQAAVADGRARAGRCVECRYSGATRAQAFGERALRAQFDLELARQILALELFVLADVAGDHTRDLPVFEQDPESEVVDAAVVRDDREAADPELGERFDRVFGNSAEPETAGQQGDAALDVGAGFARALEDFLHAAANLPGNRLEFWPSFAPRAWVISKMKPAVLLSIALGVLTSSVGAWPHSTVRAAPKMISARFAANAAALKFGKSMGSPTEGHLLGGARLDDTPYLHVLPHDVPGDVRWGLTPLVLMIDHGARTVQKKYPGAVLEVGHLSRAGGGDVGDHASHESGRDADIAYYVKNNAEKQVFSDRMVPFKGDGTAPTWPGAKFDDAKNWALISSFVQDPANVTHIFVSAPIRARLLAYAEKNGAAPAVRDRAAVLMMQPHGSLPHDDHFHVRIGCPSGQHECVENPQPKKKLQITHVPKPKKRDRAGAPVAPSKDDSVEEKSTQKAAAPQTPEQEEKANDSSDQASPETPIQSGTESAGPSSVILAAPNDPPEGD